MGMHENITYDSFPDQGSHLGAAVEVCFHYDTDHTLKGRVVRDDNTAPGVLIIALDNGRFVLASECQYRILRYGPTL